MRGGLEVAFQVDDEWMVDDGKDFLLTLDVIDLFQFDYCTLFEAF